MVECLCRLVYCLVGEGLAGQELVYGVPRWQTKDRLITLVAGIAIADLDFSLRAIAAQLEAMRKRTLRGDW